MAYTLEEFCADCHKALAAHNDRSGRDTVRQKLERLLANDEFVAAHCGPNAEPGIHTLYHDPDLDFYVLAHINTKARRSPPHDHGPSWAVYGQAVGRTDMTVWKRNDDGSKPGYADIEPDKIYRMTPGKAGMFDIGAIHQIEFSEGARFVRVTGTDLSTVKTYKYDSDAKTMETADRSGQHQGAGTGQDMAAVR
jgi:hypothetical protein